MIVNIFKTAVYNHSKKNFLKAKEIYEMLLKTNPNNFDILQNYAVLLSQIKEYKKADIVFKKCLEERPKMKWTKEEELEKLLNDINSKMKQEFDTLSKESSN